MISSLSSVARFVVGPIVAAIALAANAGCGGCGSDPVPATLSANPGGCIVVDATVGWGCEAGSGSFFGDNTCATPLTIRAVDTRLTSDLIVAPGDSFAVAVDGQAGFPAGFQLELAGAPITLTVDWTGG